MSLHRGRLVLKLKIVVNLHTIRLVTRRKRTRRLLMMFRARVANECKRCLLRGNRGYRVNRRTPVVWIGTRPLIRLI